MPVEPLQFRGVECSVCEQRFDGMADFKRHDDSDGQPCPGGTPG